MSPEYVEWAPRAYRRAAINLELPRSLAGAGTVTVRVSVGGSFSNTGFLAFR